jgi:hypothetical protein
LARADQSALTGFNRENQACAGGKAARCIAPKMPSSSGQEPETRSREFVVRMRLLAAATITAAISSATPLIAAQIGNYKVATWDVGVYTNDQNGRFTHCAAAARYQSGITLLFSVSESLEWAIGFSSPEWNLREGRNFDVDFRVDGNRTYTVNGRAVNNRLIRATLPDSAELFNQFRYGYRILARVDNNREVTFNLQNTNPMLTDLLNCARKYKGYVDRPGSNRPREDDRDTGDRRGDNRTPPPPKQQTQQNPGSGSSGSFSNQGDSRVARIPDRERDNRDRDRDQDMTKLERQPPIPQNPTPETRAEATQIATDILRRANFTFEFQKPDERNDVTWRAEEFLGTLRILPGVRAETIEKIRSEVVASDQTACKGKFDTGTLPAMADSKSVTMFTSCKGEKASSTYYILLPRRKGGIYLLGILGSGDAAARVQTAVIAYRTVALEVLEK